MICSFDCTTYNQKIYLQKYIISIQIRAEQGKWIKLNDVMRCISIERNNMVITEKRIHLFPYRTQKLSSSSLMVLRPKGLGRVGHSQLWRRRALYARLFLSYSQFLLWLEYTNHQWKSQAIFNFTLILKSNRIMEIFHKKWYTKHLLTKDML